MVRQRDGSHPVLTVRVLVIGCDASKRESTWDQLLYSWYSIFGRIESTARAFKERGGLAVKNS